MPRATKNIILSMMFGLINESNEPPAADEPPMGNSNVESANQPDAALSLEKTAAVRPSQEPPSGENGSEVILSDNPQEDLAENMQTAESGAKV
jgi:hypothetical protein